MRRGRGRRGIDSQGFVLRGRDCRGFIRERSPVGGQRGGGCRDDPGSGTSGSIRRGWRHDDDRRGHRAVEESERLLTARRGERPDSGGLVGERNQFHLPVGRHLRRARTGRERSGSDRGVGTCSSVTVK